MRYQLVLQFPFSGLTDYDALIELENILDKLLAFASGAEVDGHDAGVGEMNIFITASDPEHTFSYIKKFIRPDMIADMRAGFRELDKEDYTPLWPIELEAFEVQ